MPESDTVSGIHVMIYTCDAAQGLLANLPGCPGTHMARLPREIPAASTEADFVRITLSIEWTRRPEYAALTPTSLNEIGNAAVRGVRPYRGPTQLADPRPAWLDEYGLNGGALRRVEKQPPAASRDSWELFVADVHRFRDVLGRSATVPPSTLADQRSRTTDAQYPTSAGALRTPQRLPPPSRLSHWGDSRLWPVPCYTRGSPPGRRH
jgi:hypothetical protein